MIETLLLSGKSGLLVRMRSVPPASSRRSDDDPSAYHGLDCGVSVIPLNCEAARRRALRVAHPGHARSRLSGHRQPQHSSVRLSSDPYVARAGPPPLGRGPALAPGDTLVRPGRWLDRHDLEPGLDAP